MIVRCSKRLAFLGERGSTVLARLHDSTPKMGVGRCDGKRRMERVESSAGRPFARRSPSPRPPSQSFSLPISLVHYGVPQGFRQSLTQAGAVEWQRPARAVDGIGSRDGWRKTWKKRGVKTRMERDGVDGPWKCQVPGGIPRRPATSFSAEGRGSGRRDSAYAPAVLQRATCYMSRCRATCVRIEESAGRSCESLVMPSALLPSAAARSAWRPPARPHSGSRPSA